MKTVAISLLALTLSTSAFACPLINGKYTKKETNGGNTTTIEISLQSQAGSPYSYSLGEGMPLMPADGQPRRMEGDGQTGTLTLSCSGNTVSAVAVVDGQGTANFVYTKLSETQVQVQTNADPSMNGVFTK
jgi:hypothetical protein